MPEITNDEFTVLMIAAEGESMIPIGRWKAPILALTERGLMQRNGESNYGITLAGREACAERDREDDTSLRQLLESNNAFATARASAQQMVEQAAQNLVAAARESAKVTGDAPVHALREWSKAALQRALELLNA